LSIPPLFQAIIENDAQLEAARQGRVVPIGAARTIRALREDRERLNAAAAAALRRDPGRQGRA